MALSNRKTNFTSNLNVSHTVYGKLENHYLISIKGTNKTFITSELLLEVRLVSSTWKNNRIPKVSGFLINMHDIVIFGIFSQFQVKVSHIKLKSRNSHQEEFCKKANLQILAAFANTITLVLSCAQNEFQCRFALKFAFYFFFNFNFKHFN